MSIIERFKKFCGISAKQETTMPINKDLYSGLGDYVDNPLLGTIDSDKYKINLEKLMQQQQEELMRQSMNQVANTQGHIGSALNNINNGASQWQSSHEIMNHRHTFAEGIFAAGARAIIDHERLVIFSKVWSCPKCTNDDQSKITRKFSTGQRQLTEQERKDDAEDSSGKVLSAGSYATIAATKEVDYLELRCGCCGYTVNMCTADSVHNL